MGSKMGSKMGPETVPVRYPTQTPTNAENTTIVMPNGSGRLCKYVVFRWNSSQNWFQNWSQNGSLFGTLVFSGFGGRKPFQDASKPLYNEFPEKSGPHLGARLRELSFLALERDPSKNHVWRVPGSLPGASWEPLGASREPPGSLLGLSFGGSWVYWLMDGLVGCRASRIELFSTQKATIFI